MKNLTFTSLILLITSCGSASLETKKIILEKNYAGYWIDYKVRWNQDDKYEIENTLQITCDGNLKYSIKEPYALLFKEDTDDGKIISIKGDYITHKSWLGFTRTSRVYGPEKLSNNCYSISFRGKEFKTFYPTDCNAPTKSLSEILDDAFKSFKDKNYVYCD